MCRRVDRHWALKAWEGGRRRYAASQETCRATINRSAAGGAAGSDDEPFAQRFPPFLPIRAIAPVDAVSAAPPPAATLLVCVTCKFEGRTLGADLCAALAGPLEAEGVAVQPVECLSVCKRPCTVALAAAGKWTYVVGDLDRETHFDDIVTAARRYAASPDGLVPWRERPLPFRKGVISRIPPLARPPEL